MFLYIKFTCTEFLYFCRVNFIKPHLLRSKLHNTTLLIILSYSYIKINIYIYNIYMMDKMLINLRCDCRTQKCNRWKSK